MTDAGKFLATCALRGVADSDPAGKGHMKNARDELEDLFGELGELEEVRTLTRNRLLAYDLQQAMKAKTIRIARAMGKSIWPTVFLRTAWNC